MASGTVVDSSFHPLVYPAPNVSGDACMTLLPGWLPRECRCCWDYFSKSMGSTLGRRYTNTHSGNYTLCIFAFITAGVSYMYTCTADVSDPREGYNPVCTDKPRVRFPRLVAGLAKGNRPRCSCCIRCPCQPPSVMLQFHPSLVFALRPRHPGADRAAPLCIRDARLPRSIVSVAVPGS